jgi:hypothetical protein
VKVLVVIVDGVGEIDPAANRDRRSLTLAALSASVSSSKSIRLLSLSMPRRCKYVDAGGDGLGGGGGFLLPTTLKTPFDGGTTTTALKVDLLALPSSLTVSTIGF